jgi:hypothetical protein
MTDIQDIYTGKMIVNDLLDNGHAPKCSWGSNLGTPFPRMMLPRDWPHGLQGYEGAHALSAQLGSRGIRGDIRFYPNGQVDLYCPGGKLTLSLAEAMRLARLLDGEKPDACPAED